MKRDSLFVLLYSSPARLNSIVQPGRSLSAAVAGAGWVVCKQEDE